MRDYLTKCATSRISISSRATRTPAPVRTSGSSHHLLRVHAARAKKKKKVERTRFRETTHSFRQKSAAGRFPSDRLLRQRQRQQEQERQASAKRNRLDEARQEGKDPFRQGSAGDFTQAPSSQTEDAGAVPAGNRDAAAEPDNPLENAAPPEKKTRFSDRARGPKQKKTSAPQKDALAPAPPDAAEVADRQPQSAPLGLGGTTVSEKEKEVHHDLGRENPAERQKKSRPTRRNRRAQAKLHRLRFLSACARTATVSVED